MKPRKAVGSSDVTTDLIKFAGESAIKERTKCFMKYSRGQNAQWTVAINKGKGDPLQCGKH